MLRRCYIHVYIGRFSYRFLHALANESLLAFFVLGNANQFAFTLNASVLSGQAIAQRLKVLINVWIKMDVLFWIAAELFRCDSIFGNADDTRARAEHL